MIYLDNGATSFPKPRIVTRETAGCLLEYAVGVGRGSHALSLRAAEKVWETRELLARLFGIPTPERIAFTQNCTEAINVGLKGILSAGDDLLISDMEHNSVYRPSIGLSGRGVKTLFIKSDKEGRVFPEAVERMLTPRTKMVCLQHASNVGGGINPIREIGKLCREKGILFMVDAAQTAGTVPIDVERDCIDLLAFPGHKGLLGPQGTGGLYVREGIPIRPMREGGTGSASESAEMPEFLPDRLEGGTINLPGIAGLAGGVRFVLKTGVNAIRRHERVLLSRFLKGIKGANLRILGPEKIEDRVGLVSVVVPGKDSADIASVLHQKYKIATRAGLHCSPLAAARFGILDKGSVRFSPGVFNTPEEMEYAARALSSLARP